MSERSDIELLRQMQRGDRKAMEQFFHRFAPYLHSVCRRYMPEPDDAKDILHDTFLKIFTSVKSFSLADGADPTAQLKAWGARIAANLALNRLRSLSRLRFVADPEGSIPDIADDDVDPNPLSAEQIASIISELPPGYRTVFNLYAVEGFCHREIARMTGISEATSASQYHRAKALLKQKIKTYLESL